MEKIEDMEKIIDRNYGRTDVFEIVTEFPNGYVLWNIGRANFPHPGFIPLARPKPENKYYIRLDTLKALRLDDEDLCLHLMREGHRRWMDAPTFFEVVADWESKKRKKNLPCKFGKSK